MIYFYLFIFLVFLVMISLLIFSKHKKEFELKNGKKTLIVIGSGGHTAEIMRLISKFPCHYQPRLYVMADDDTTSDVKIFTTENILNSNSDAFEIVKVPRSRHVGQSYITSIGSTCYSAFKSFQHILKFTPDLVLCNGPGTCVPICIIAFILSKVLRWHTKIIFVESICRVKTLSLSGKILLHVADFVVVQWPELQAEYPTTVYLGRLF